MEPGRPAPRLIAQAFANFGTRRAGAFGLSYTHQARRDAEPVGLRGEVYVTGLDANNDAQAAWGEQTCVINVSFPESSHPLPDLGTFTCSGVTR